MDMALRRLAGGMNVGKFHMRKSFNVVAMQRQREIRISSGNAEFISRNAGEPVYLRAANHGPNKIF
jgi:hypothetical protein